MEVGPARRRGVRLRVGKVLTLIAMLVGPTGPSLAQPHERGPVAITVAATIVAQPATRTPIVIRVGPQEALPRNSYVRIRGLPQTVALSEGYAIAPGAWAVPLSVLPVLAAVIPIGERGASSVRVDLMSLEGDVLAESRTMLVIAPPATSSGGPGPARTDTPARGQLAPADRDQALRFHSKGLELLERGDVDAARRFLERAADMGLAQSAMTLATTYDPNELARLKVVGLQPNSAMARKWYDRAAVLGAAGAGDRLERLGAR
jgi:hypothetical protein